MWWFKTSGFVEQKGNSYAFALNLYPSIVAKKFWRDNTWRVHCSFQTHFSTVEDQPVPSKLNLIWKTCFCFSHDVQMTSSDSPMFFGLRFKMANSTWMLSALTVAVHKAWGLGFIQKHRRVGRASLQVTIILRICGHRCRLGGGNSKSSFFYVHTRNHGEKWSNPFLTIIFFQLGWWKTTN